MSATGKIVGVTAQSMMQRIHRFTPEKPDISMATEAKMDKMYH